MQKFNEDCFYFLTSVCTKGTSCSYRHNPLVINCNVTCPAWLRGTCSDLNCALRHSHVQRPSITASLSCLYEKMATGCLKPDCPFMHSRPRLHLRNPAMPRPSTTNLINNDLKKTPIPNAITSTTSVSTTTTPHTEPIVAKPESPKITEKPLTPNPPPIATVEKKPVELALAPVVERRAIEKNEPQPTRSVVTSASTTESADKKSNANLQSRLVVNRAVVIAETNSKPTRTIVQATSNRVIVSSNSLKSIPEQKQTNKMKTEDSDSDLDDLIEVNHQQLKGNADIDITFPCTSSPMSGRLFITSKTSTMATTLTNDNKPIRLKRDHLSSTITSNTNSEKSMGSVTNGKKISSGTGLSEEDERRINRLERFKKKPESPVKSTTATLSNKHGDSNKREEINPTSNGRKRSSGKHSSNDSPPPKRISQSSSHSEIRQSERATTIGDLCSPPSSPPNRNQYHHHHHSYHSPRRSSSPPLLHSLPFESKQPYSLPPAMSDAVWKQAVDQFLAQTAQVKKPTPISIVQPLPKNHRMIPQRLPTPRPSISNIPESPHISIQRPVINKTPSTINNTKPTVPISSNNVNNQISPAPTPSTKTITPRPEPEQLPVADDDENELLELDTCALIDEVLLEADDLLELS